LLIDEKMGPRIEKAFSKSHPLYWEFKNRQALFRRVRGRDMDDDEGARLREGAETLLRKVLIWRVANLGPNNPQTQRTQRVLRNFYIQSERYQDAKELPQLLTANEQADEADASDEEMDDD
jgi:hypothetical protein